MPWSGLNMNRPLHCAAEKLSVPTQRKHCRTFGYSWCSLTSTSQTPIPLILRGCPAPYSCMPRRSWCQGSPVPIHAKQSRDETRASYKQVYLHFDWSTDSRYRFLLHNSTRASAKYAFFLIHVQKNPKTNKRKDKECGSIYSQLVRLSLQSTHLHSPSPVMPTLWSASLVSNGCIVSEER